MTERSSSVLFCVALLFAHPYRSFQYGHGSGSLSGSFSSSGASSSASSSSFSSSSSYSSSGSFGKAGSTGNDIAGLENFIGAPSFAGASAGASAGAFAGATAGSSAGAGSYSGVKGGGKGSPILTYHGPGTGGGVGVGGASLVGTDVYGSAAIKANCGQGSCSHLPGSGPDSSRGGVGVADGSSLAGTGHLPLGTGPDTLENGGLGTYADNNNFKIGPHKPSGYGSNTNSGAGVGGGVGIGASGTFLGGGGKQDGHGCGPSGCAPGRSPTGPTAGQGSPVGIGSSGPFLGGGAKQDGQGCGPSGCAPGGSPAGQGSPILTYHGAGTGGGIGVTDGGSLIGTDLYGSAAIKADCGQNSCSHLRKVGSGPDDALLGGGVKQNGQDCGPLGCGGDGKQQPGTKPVVGLGIPSGGVTCSGLSCLQVPSKPSTPCSNGGCAPDSVFFPGAVGGYGTSGSYSGSSGGPGYVSGGVVISKPGQPDSSTYFDTFKPGGSQQGTPICRPGDSRCANVPSFGTSPGHTQPGYPGSGTPPTKEGSGPAQFIPSSCGANGIGCSPSSAIPSPSSTAGAATGSYSPSCGANGVGCGPANIHQITYPTKPGYGTSGSYSGPSGSPGYVSGGVVISKPGQPDSSTYFDTSKPGSSQQGTPTCRPGDSGCANVPSFGTSPGHIQPGYQGSETYPTKGGSAPAQFSPSNCGTNGVGCSPSSAIPSPSSTAGATAGSYSPSCGANGVGCGPVNIPTITYPTKPGPSSTGPGYKPDAGSHYTGPFPGKPGSIHDSKPAGHKPGLSGIAPQYPSQPGTKPGYGGQPATSPNVPYPTQPESDGGVHYTGHFPGPTGPIDASKPASSVKPHAGATAHAGTTAGSDVYHPKPTIPSSSSTSSGTSAGVHYTGPFPGPSGSIHDNKPALAKAGAQAGATASTPYKPQQPTVPTYPGYSTGVNAGSTAGATASSAASADSATSTGGSSQSYQPTAPTHSGTSGAEIAKLGLSQGVPPSEKPGKIGYGSKPEGGVDTPIIRVIPTPGTMSGTKPDVSSGVSDEFAFPSKTQPCTSGNCDVKANVGQGCGGSGCATQPGTVQSPAGAFGGSGAYSSSGAFSSSGGGHGLPGAGAGTGISGGAGIGGGHGLGAGIGAGVGAGAAGGSGAGGSGCAACSGLHSLINGFGTSLSGAGSYSGTKGGSHGGSKSSAFSSSGASSFGYGGAQAGSFASSFSSAGAHAGHY